MSISTEDKNRGIRQGLWLEYSTLAWNVVGVFIVLYAALHSGSVALGGFGLDSLIEILASAVVVWQLKGIDDGREARSLKIISVAFLLLVIYILVQNIHSLATNEHPHSSLLGMVWLAVTFIVMLSLAIGKSKVGKKIQNTVLLTEGKVTLVDTYLAGAVLVGLVLNAALGWWWADPLASLVIVYYGAKESLHAWKEAKSFQ